MTDPIRPTDDAAREMAQGIMRESHISAIATLTPEGTPMTTRIAFGLAADRAPITFVSTLSQHTAALTRDPRCSLLIGEPAPKGDPLTHPRLTLQAQAQMISRDAAVFPDLQKGWLESHPKSRLYIDFADFLFVRFRIEAGFLNGGFGKAFLLTPDDLGL